VALNLHAAVRSVIPGVKADTVAYWYVNKGPTALGNGGRQVATYEPAVQVMVQQQPPSGRDIQFINMLQLQGVIRSVWMFSNPGGINRANQVGNDLLMFPQWPGGPLDVWKVARPDENWDVSSGGFSKVYAVLQTDRLYSVLDDSGLLVLDDLGRIVRSK